MNRRTFFRNSSLFGFGSMFPKMAFNDHKTFRSSDHRAQWIDVLDKLSEPVLINLSKGTLTQNMPVEALNSNAKKFNTGAYLEAFGRLIAGIAPWFNITPVDESEKSLQQKYSELLFKSIENAVTPGSPDYLIYPERNQTVVDAAFFAHALLKSKKSIWDNLNTKAQNDVIQALKTTRVITPAINNKLLFSAIIEAFFMEVGLIMT